MSRKPKKNLESKEPQAKSSDLFESLRSISFFLILLYLIPQIENWIGQDNIKNYINSVGIWAPIVFILIRILTVVIAPLRLGPITTLLHRAFGFWPSLFYNTIVVVIGSTLNFFISKKWGNKIIGFFFGQNILSTIDKYAQKYLVGKFINTLLIFLSNYEIAGYASGLTTLKWQRVSGSALATSLITGPILIFRDLSIGNNDFLATCLYILGYLISTVPILYITREDLSIWWKQELEKINSKS